MTTQKIVVPGKPIPQPRPRIFKRGKFSGAYDPAKTSKEEHMEHLKKKYKMFIMEPPIRMELVAYMPIPKSGSEKSKAALIGQPHTKRPDIDNITKYYLDMLGDDNIFTDDSHVYNIDCRKIYGINPRVELTFKNDETD